MKSMKPALLAAVMMSALAVSAVAGPFRDFETSLREVWADYRVALFATNAGKPAEAEKAMDALRSKWTRIEAEWATTPPPQYADDPHWHETVTAVNTTAEKAADEVASVKLPQAHETLEAIRGQIGKLHERNGIVSFTDRMNAFHELMEHVLSTDSGSLDAQGFEQLEANAAVLNYLAEQALGHPPPDGAGSPEFRKLGGDLRATVETLLLAARDKDVSRVKPAMAALKPAYARLFVKFG